MENNYWTVAMSIITHDRPAPKYYTNIIQYDDGNWAADPLPVDDYVVYPIKGGYDTAGLPKPGLRTVVSGDVITMARNIINKYAPNDLQRNSLYILLTQTSGTDWTNAKAMMDWIVSINNYRDTEVANVKTLNFNQLVAYLPPQGMPPWPAPPAVLVPGGMVMGPMVGSVAYTLRNS
jgi:hypothetical protein